jgi:hypothetical protein
MSPKDNVYRSLFSCQLIEPEGVIAARSIGLLKGGALAGRET